MSNIIRTVTTIVIVHMYVKKFEENKQMNGNQFNIAISYAMSFSIYIDQYCQ